MRLVAILACLLLAGCATAPTPVPPTPDPDEVRLGGSVLHHGGVRGGLSLLHLGEGDEATIRFPPGVLLLGDDGHLRPALDAVTLARGEVVQYLPPYGAQTLRVEVTTEGATDEVELALDEGRPFVDGMVPVELMKVQRERFPHRTPGMESYGSAVAYFEEYFAALSYEVETFRTPLPELSIPVGPAPNTESLVSVVGYKRGTLSPERYIVFGGHFDVVEATTEGAFDNTGGTMATLAMAQAFARVNTSHTLIFAAWGGEEDGILGSQAWVTAHPEIVPFIDLYVNFDVTGIAWPAPVVDPAPVVASTGPDGPVGDALAQQHRTVVAEWMQLDAPFVYEPVGQGQAAGAGVNAQSDHTPFMARGIPVLFQFTSRIDDVFALIHSERDTLDNMTKYALLGPDGVGADIEPAQYSEAEAALAKSFETQMVPAFYLAVLTDGGVLAPARPASFLPLENARS